MTNESLQSWVYRYLIVHGLTDFSDVIGQNGQWRELPLTFNVHRPSITQYDDEDILQLFLASSIRVKDKKFPKPWEYVDEVVKYFEHKNHRLNNTRTKPIKYCPFCINNSIKEYGFGYFKASWLEEDYCKEHNFWLINEDTRTRKDGVSKLKKALNGGVVCKVGNSEQLVAISEEKPPTEYFYGGEYFMPCLLMDFYWFASFRERNVFSLEVAYGFFNQNGSRKGLQYFYSGEEVDAVHFIKNKLREIKRIFPDEVQRYLKSRSELVFYNYGISDKKSFFTTLVAKKERNCSKCIIGFKGSMCPISQVIKVFKVGEAYKPRRLKMNMCDRYVCGNNYGY